VFRCLGSVVKGWEWKCHVRVLDLDAIEGYDMFVWRREYRRGVEIDAWKSMAASSLDL